MNPKHLGDSYDIVKRFICDSLHNLGYAIEVEPMYTGTWNPSQKGQYRRLIGSDANVAPEAPVAVFIDPDTGVSECGSKRHISLAKVAESAKRATLVFVFDQSFSRNVITADLMREKMASLEERGCHAMYYDSHARFLFVASKKCRLDSLRQVLIGRGIPEERLIMGSI